MTFITWLKKPFKINAKPGLTPTDIDDKCSAYCAEDARSTLDNNHTVLRLIFKVPGSMSMGIITRDVAVNNFFEPSGPMKVIQGVKTESVPLGELKTYAEERMLHPPHIQWLINDRARLIMSVSDLQGIYKTVDFDLADTVRGTEGLYNDRDFCVDRLSDLSFVGFSVVSTPFPRLIMRQL